MVVPYPPSTADHGRDPSPFQRPSPAAAAIRGLLGQVTALESGRRALQGTAICFFSPRAKGSSQANARNSVIRGRSCELGSLGRLYASRMQVICSHRLRLQLFHFILRSVESSETILLRRLTLRLINHISLFLSLAGERLSPPSPPRCACLLEKRLYVSPPPPCQVRWDRPHDNSL